jgi:hypothetical protein
MDLIGLLAQAAQEIAGPSASPRTRARILAAVLALLVVLLLMLMALVGMSAIRRRLRADAPRSKRPRRRTRAVDAWAEAGRRAELAEAGPEGGPDGGFAGDEPGSDPR